jgi:hypothetical protein
MHWLYQAVPGSHRRNPAVKRSRRPIIVPRPGRGRSNLDTTGCHSAAGSRRPLRRPWTSCALTVGGGDGADFPVFAVVGGGESWRAARARSWCVSGDTRRKRQRGGRSHPLSRLQTMHRHAPARDAVGTPIHRRVRRQCGERGGAPRSLTAARGHDLPASREPRLRGMPAGGRICMRAETAGCSARCGHSRCWQSTGGERRHLPALGTSVSNSVRPALTG